MSLNTEMHSLKSKVSPCSLKNFNILLKFVTSSHGCRMVSLNDEHTVAHHLVGGMLDGSLGNCFIWEWSLMILSY